jgi:hypothetical protein
MQINQNLSLLDFYFVAVLIHHCLFVNVSVLFLNIFRIYSFVFLSLCLSVSLSLCLSVSLSLCLSVSLSLCLSVSRLSVLLSFCLSVFLFFYLAEFLISEYFKNLFFCFSYKAEQKDKTRTKKEFHYLLSRQMNFDKRKTDKQTYRQIDKKTERQKYKQTNSR